MKFLDQDTIEKWIRWHEEGASVAKIWELEHQFGPCPCKKTIKGVLIRAGVYVRYQQPERPKARPPEVVRLPERKRPVYTSSIPPPTKAQLMAGSAWVGRV